MSLNHSSPVLASKEKDEGPSRASTDTNFDDLPAHERVDEPMSSAGGTLNGAEIEIEKAEGFSVPEPAGAAKTEEYVYLTGIPLAIVLFAVTFVAFLMLLDSSIIVTAIPRITSDFHSLNDVGWYGSAYLIASCAFQPTAGKLYAHYSSKWLFLGFLGIFELGSLLCGVAQSSTMLIIGRAVAGIGTSGIMNGAFTIINACVPMHKVPAYLGALTGLAQLGILFGPLIGGALTEFTTWRWCFYINLPIGGLVSLLLFRIQIPTRAVISTEKRTIVQILTQLDIVGFFIFAPSAIQALLALQWGGVTYAWSSATIIGLFCGSGATLIVFGVWEYHMGEAAMLPFSMLKRTVVWSASLVMFFFFGNLYMTTFYLPIYFQAVRDATPTLSGVYLLSGIIPTMITAVTSGILVGKLGYYLPFAVLSGVLMSIGTGLLSMLTPHTSTGQWIGYQILAGAGRGMGFQMSIVAVQNALPPHQIALGTSTVIFAQTFGGAVILSIGQTIFNEALNDGLKRYAPNVDIEAVIHAGATAIENVVQGADFAAVKEAYSFAVRHTQYLGAGCGVAVVIFSLGLGWKSVKKAKAVPEVQAEEGKADVKENSVVPETTV